MGKAWSVLANSVCWLLAQRLPALRSKQRLKAVTNSGFFLMVLFIYF